jgi:hypothetical protein
MADKSAVAGASMVGHADDDGASLLSLTSVAFAWEFARRSHAYQDAWNRHGHDHGADASGFGLLVYEDPDLDAHQAMPLWRPDTNCQVLPMIGDLRRKDRIPSLFEDLPCQVRRMPVSNGEHVLFGDQGRFLQLDVTGGIGDFHTLTLHSRVLTSPCCLTLHWRALRQFADLVRYRALRPRVYPAVPRARRLVQMLRVLDFAATEPSQRNLAAAMFGEERVRREWGHGTDHLRDWVRYTLRAARALSNKGYIKLLR